ncbi:hypothetical protein DKX38_029393 [Salix brachista]|uniref:Uncharacterized protein n=1 Tax=Salix brachista TaxID=2182728 RepID=A0A5N5J3X1_9ROSI|nr:hypothetical protein DKX38_029393 [Salix brachista]
MKMKDDEILVIAEDDDSYAPAALPMVKESSFMHIARPARMSQKPPNLFFSSPGCCRYGEEVYPKTYCSKVCRKDIVLWLETRHGRYDYGNVIRIMKS